MIDPIDLAQYDTVHGFKGGSVKLAPLINMNAGTLSNKVSPAMEGHHLTVRESIAIQHTTHNYSILQAQAQALGFSCIQLGDFSRVSDVELLSLYSAWHADVGATEQAIHDALADGKIERAEVQRIKNEIHSDIQKGFEFIARLEALIDD